MPAPRPAPGATEVPAASTGGSGGGAGGRAEAEERAAVVAARPSKDAGTDVAIDGGGSDATDAGSDVPPCGADGTSCTTANSAAGICLTKVCHACVDTTDDAKCATAYGAGNICVSGKCGPGNCHASTGCDTGQVCGATVANKCGTCASDTQCQTDTHYGAAFICDTTTGHANSGKCVSSMCTAVGTCAANTADTCCTKKCVTGNCCADDDCHTNSQFGASYFCSANHVCSTCAAVAGNHYFVDPIGGSDTSTATGSGKVGTAALASCSFRTITHALEVIGNAPAAGTTITIVGSATATTALYAHAATAGAPTPEHLPIAVPSSVTITTSGGAISLLLDAAGSGVALAGDGAAIAAITGAPLMIDGANISGVAIASAPGTGKVASIANVAIKNTGDDGIVVGSGTLNIGAGVTVTGAGHVTATGRRSGVHVAGGTVTITVPAGQTASTFNGNTLHGLEVTLLGVLNVVGVPVTTPAITGAGTVVASGNSRANVYIEQTPGLAPAVSSIDGLVAWNSTNGAGLEIVGGSKVRLRNSVSLGNSNGVLITGAAATVAGNALGGIDLGTATGFGHNIMQDAAAANRNAGAGLCVSLEANGGVQSLSRGRQRLRGAGRLLQAHAGRGASRKAATCANHVDEAIEPSATSTVTIVSANCL